MPSPLSFGSFHLLISAPTGSNLSANVGIYQIAKTRLRAQQQLRQRCWQVVVARHALEVVLAVIAE